MPTLISDPAARMEITLEPPYLIVKPFVTEEQFYRDADEDSNWEYLDGRLVMHSPASRRHEDLFSFLMTLVRGFLDVRGTAAGRPSPISSSCDASVTTCCAPATSMGRPTS
jgi:Uma2 family endonuclease